tara:strand:- start:943 stop:1479 length:537 start_codon:yes stop_codon:yes gene_type:complete
MAEQIMNYQFDSLKGSDVFNGLVVGHDAGFRLYRNLLDLDITALDVAEQYYHAEKQKALVKQDKVNYNNRWFQPNCVDCTKRIQKIYNYISRQYKTKQCDIYASWVRDGHSYGRHKDTMDVLILQVWNEMAYCIESPYGEKQHTSFTLSPGDAIYIRSGVYHTPIILGERMTMSFSWG